MPIRIKGFAGPKWYVLYCGLAALQFVCLTFGLYVSHRIINTFSAAIAENQVSTERLGRFSELGEAMSAASAPGNDIFETNDAAAETLRLEAASQNLARKLRLLELDLAVLAKSDEAVHIKEDLAKIQSASAEAVTQGHSIIKIFSQGQHAEAGQQMAAMDRKFAVANDAIADAGRDILEYRRQHFVSQNAIVEYLRALELAGAAIIVGLLGAMIFYGYHLAAVMEKGEAEREEQRDALSEQAQQLKESAKNAEAASKAKSRFLANMSHEIRTPMNGVLGMTDLLLRSDLTGKQRRFAETIYRSGTSLLAIINDILDFSRIEAAKIELQSQAFDVRAVVESCIELLAESAGRKGLALDHFIAPDVPTGIQGDPGRLRQILLNLVGNAIKFTSKGEVAIRVSKLGETDAGVCIAFEVRDTGIGIPQEGIPSLFDPFQQADGSITRRFGGTGLGLSISRQLANLMGGDIGFESEEGVGTTVTLTIAAPVAALNPVAGRKSGLELAGKSILIVDDRQANREILEAYVTEAGGSVMAVANGGAAIDYMRFKHKAGAPFDVAIIDMMLPDMTGLDVVRNMRASTAKIATRFVMLSSGAAPDQSREAEKLGFRAFLMKPILRTDFIAAIQQAVSDDAETAAETAAEPDNLPFDGARILVAEDNPINLEVARQFLLDLGCTVEAVENGAEAFEAMKVRAFDLVLMDCQMPVMDGLAATRAMRENERATGRGRTAIVAVTANAYEEDRRTCLAAGMDDYLSKPFSPEQLADILRKWVNVAAREEETGDGTAPALDPPYISSLKGSRPEFFERLCGLFSGFAPSAMKEIADASVAKDADQVGRLAHSLRSSSANIGALPFSDICARLQQAARPGWQEPVMTGLIDELEREFVRLERALAGERSVLSQARKAMAAS